MTKIYYVELLQNKVLSDKPLNTKYARAMKMNAAQVQNQTSFSGSAQKIRTKIYFGI